MTEPYTPCWKDAHGVVHIVGTHSHMGVWTECSWRIAGSAGSVGGNTMIKDRYQESFDVPTCFMCLGDSIDFRVFVEEGIAIVNVSALSKLEFNDD